MEGLEPLTVEIAPTKSKKDHHFYFNDSPRSADPDAANGTSLTSKQDNNDDNDGFLPSRKSLNSSNTSDYLKSSEPLPAEKGMKGQADTNKPLSQTAPASHKATLKKSADVRSAGKSSESSKSSTAPIISPPSLSSRKRVGLLGSFEEPKRPSPYDLPLTKQGSDSKGGEGNVGENGNEAPNGTRHDKSLVRANGDSQTSSRMDANGESAKTPLAHRFVTPSPVKIVPNHTNHSHDGESDAPRNPSPSRSGRFERSEPLKIESDPKPTRKQLLSFMNPTGPVPGKPDEEVEVWSPLSGVDRSPSAAYKDEKKKKKPFKESSFLTKEGDEGAKVDFNQLFQDLDTIGKNPPRKSASKASLGIVEENKTLEKSDSKAKLKPDNAGANKTPKTSVSRLNSETLGGVREHKEGLSPPSSPKSPKPTTAERSAAEGNPHKSSAKNKGGNNDVVGASQRGSQLARTPSSRRDMGASSGTSSTNRTPSVMSNGGSGMGKKDSVSKLPGADSKREVDKKAMASKPQIEHKKRIPLVSPEAVGAGVVKRDVYALPRNRAATTTPGGGGRRRGGDGDDFDYGDEGDFPPSGRAQSTLPPSTSILSPPKDYAPPKDPHSKEFIRFFSERENSARKSLDTPYMKAMRASQSGITSPDKADYLFGPSWTTNMP